MFSDKIKYVRKAKDLSMEELCDMYNKKFNGKLNKSTLSRYENNLQEPMLTVVRNLAEILDVDINFLTDDEIVVENDNKQEPQDLAFFRLKKGLESYDIVQEDIDFLLTVMKAHKERNK